MNMEFASSHPKLSSIFRPKPMLFSPHLPNPMRMKQNANAGRFQIRYQLMAKKCNNLQKTMASGLPTADFIEKRKVVFVLGTTAVGKSKLGIDLATHFGGEIVNSDKIQVYKGLDILTNKESEEKCKGIPQHLIGFVDPEEEFGTQDFCNHARMALGHILGNGKIPIVVGGSNRYIEALVDKDPLFRFRDHYDSCFLWVDVSLPILFDRAEKRVDEMLDSGLLDEVRDVFVQGRDHNRGIWRATGVEELAAYFQAEIDMVDDITKEMLLDTAICEIKKSTNNLIVKQLMKIKELGTERGWKLHRIDATCVYERSGKADENVWNEKVLRHGLEIVSDFLGGDDQKMKHKWRPS